MNQIEQITLQASSYQHLGVSTLVTFDVIFICCSVQMLSRICLEQS